tara:strand:+ start:57 stop:248 length:192 start_codon:yes stop_codon:yes gene_type:complete
MDSSDVVRLDRNGNPLTPKSYKNRQKAALAEFAAGFSHKKPKKKNTPKKKLHINKGYFLGYFK